jgi:uncharacterized protein
VTLTELYVYPVKSLRGLAVEQWEVDEFGFRHDRRWMVVGANGVALTQRDLPRMALITPALTGSTLQLGAPGLSALSVECDDTAPRRPVRVWNDTVDAVDCGEPAAEWLSAFLGQPVRLVYMPDDSFRRVDPAFSPEHRRVSFADAYPFLLITQESLDGLNGRLAQPIEMRRFRPNLVVKGAAHPHAEDDWTRVTIGDITFDLVKQCIRCAVPTVNPETGVKGENPKSPTTTLATYRRFNGKVYFGQNLIHRSTGKLSRGLEVSTTETQSSQRTE